MYDNVRFGPTLDWSQGTVPVFPPNIRGVRTWTLRRLEIMNLGPHGVSASPFVMKYPIESLPARLNALRIPDLKIIIKIMGLSQSGRKQDLVDRIFQKVVVCECTNCKANIMAELQL